MSESINKSVHKELSEVGGYFDKNYSRSEIIFSTAAFIFAIVLLALIGDQTTWINGQPFTKQPAFWPAISIIGMIVTGAFELYFVWQRYKTVNLNQKITTEMLRWLQACEYLVWFMIYVWLVPFIGYLIATLIFTVLLTYRLGYRTKKKLLLAAVTGIIIVVIFKSLLSVKIPAGAIYDYLPDALRNFMVLYF